MKNLISLWDLLKTISCGCFTIGSLLTLGSLICSLWLLFGSSTWGITIFEVKILVKGTCTLTSLIFTFHEAWFPLL